MTAKIKAVVVGLGVMGQNHVRVLDRSDRYELVGVYDTAEVRCGSVAADYGVRPFVTLTEACRAADAVFVATPTVKHFSVAMRAIEECRHVFVEKPMAESSEQALQLAFSADAHGVRLAVGHAERFNPAVLWLLEHLAPDETVLSVNIERVGPRPPRIKDVGVITDLGVHDLDLIAHLTGSPIVKVHAMARATVGPHEDVAQILVATKSGAIGSVNINWLTPFKSRVVSIATSTRFLVADLMRFTVRVYEPCERGLSHHIVEEAMIKWAEPLVTQADAFAGYLAGEGAGCVSGKEGAVVLKWVDACLREIGESS